jgi:hypothetical protein
MRIGKRLIVGAYHAGFRVDCGIDRDDEHEATVGWAYLGFFGLYVGLAKRQWIYPHEATRDFTAALIAASDPQRQGDAFVDEWDRLEAEENRILASAYRSSRLSRLLR